MDNTNVRHWQMVGLVVMLLACAVTGVTAFYVVPRPGSEVKIGRLSDYPVNGAPYRVLVEDRYAFLINTGSELRLIDPQYISSDGVWHCTVKWVPTNGRFEDPCSGAKFTPLGDWLENAYAPQGVDHRGLSQYVLTVRGEEIWAALGVLRPGTLVATACTVEPDC